MTRAAFLQSGLVAVSGVVAFSPAIRLSGTAMVPAVCGRLGKKRSLKRRIRISIAYSPKSGKWKGVTKQ